MYSHTDSSSNLDLLDLSDDDEGNIANEDNSSTSSSSRMAKSHKWETPREYLFGRKHAETDGIEVQSSRSPSPMPCYTSYVAYVCEPNSIFQSILLKIEEEFKLPDSVSYDSDSSPCNSPPLTPVCTAAPLKEAPSIYKKTSDCLRNYFKDVIEFDADPTETVELLDNDIRKITRYLDGVTVSLSFLRGTHLLPDLVPLCHQYVGIQEQKNCLDYKKRVLESPRWSGMDSFRELERQLREIPESLRLFFMLTKKQLIQSESDLRDALDLFVHDRGKLDCITAFKHLVTSAFDLSRILQKISDRDRHRLELIFFFKDFIRNSQDLGRILNCLSDHSNRLELIYHLNITVDAFFLPEILKLFSADNRLAITNKVLNSQEMLAYLDLYLHSISEVLPQKARAIFLKRIPADKLTDPEVLVSVLSLLHPRDRLECALKFKHVVNRDSILRYILKLLPHSSRSEFISATRLQRFCSANQGLLEVASVFAVAGTAVGAVAVAAHLPLPRLNR